MSGQKGANGLTRRAVLRGAAVASATALVPGGAIARSPASPRAGRVFSRWVGALAPGETSAILAPRPFSMVGVEWTSGGAVRIQLRTRSREGDWGPWVTASVLGHGPDGAPADARQWGEPVWTGPTDYVQLRIARAVPSVRLHFIAPRRPGPATTARAAGAATALAQPVLDAGPGQPPIIARAAWARGQAPPRHAPEYGTVKLAFVHHSESPNGYGAADVPSILMSVFDYHRYVRDFFDIAYNFAVDAYGRIWEARAGGIDEAVIGAHAGGYNAQSTGVVVLGTFTGVVPSRAAIDALERLLAWKLSLHGRPALGRVTVVVDSFGATYTAFGPGAHVSLPRIAGHRDGDQTSCPGDALYARLPSIRPRVAQLAGTPARLRIAAPVAPVSAGSAVALTGRVTDLAGGALAGAPIEVQQVAGRGLASTIASLATDAAGGWSYTFTPTRNALMRALHRPNPAAVSDIVVISVAPVLTLALDSVAPLRVSGTVSPPKPHATIDLYRLSGGRRHPVAAKRVAVAGGGFQASIRTPRPGTYVLIARTAADARNAASASPPVEVTVS